MPLETDQNQLSIVTTTDPHAGNIWPFLACLNDFAKAYPNKLPVVVVDDLKLWPAQPPEATFQHFDRLEVDVVWYPEQRGQLTAMQSGISRVKTRWLATFDPDMYHAITQLPAMLKLAEAGHRLIHLARTGRSLPPIRQLGSYLSNWLGRLATGMSIPDINSPVVLLERQCLATLEHGPGLQPRLFLYWQLRRQTAVIDWTMQDASSMSSSYNTAALTRLFITFLYQSLMMWRYRQHLDRKNHD